MGLGASKLFASARAVREEVTGTSPETRHTVFQLVAEKHLPPLDVLQLTRTGRELQDALAPVGARLAVQAHLQPTARAAFKRLLPTLSNMTEVEAAVAAVRAIPPGFARIEAGTFTMGSPPDEAGRYENDILHSVTLSRPFFLKQTPVTQGEFEARMGFNPSYFVHGADAAARPVEQVTYFQALAYCNALSLHEGLPPTYDLHGWNGLGDYLGSDTIAMIGDGTGYRLPTEAEWEYAARAGSTAARHGDLDAVAWHDGNAGGTTHPVGQKDANAWGLHDMLGNVWEWVSDWYGALSAASQHDPVGAEAGVSRVRRGGSWDNGAYRTRAAYRYGDPPSEREYVIGFRPARYAPG